MGGLLAHHVRGRKKRTEKETDLGTVMHICLF